MSDVPISKTDENKVVAYRDGAEVTLNDPDCISISTGSAATEASSSSRLRERRPVRPPRKRNL